MLDKISMFAKNNGITIQQFNYKFSPRFPSAFYETVVEFMKLARAKYDPSDKMESFNIKFDRENNAYFEFNEPNGNARVIVIPDFTKFDNLPPAKVVRESTFFKTLLYLDENINKKIINSLPINFSKRFLKNYNEAQSIYQVMNELAEEIIRYISYLEKEKDNNIERLYFNELTSFGSKKPYTKTNTHITEDRKNDEIDFETRKRILNKYFPDMEFEAVAKNKDSEYVVKVYKIKSKCKLVMEPKEGTKYTKIIHLNTDKIDECDIKKIVITALQLDRDQTTMNKNITRHKHMSLEEYENLIDYLITGNNKGLNYSTRKNIDEASNQPNSFKI